MMRLIKFISVLFGLLFLAIGFCHALGLRINWTNSMPKGVYRFSHETSLKNQLVVFTPPDTEPFNIAKARGFFYEGAELLKKVVAVSGDVVSCTDEGVRVNGQMLPFSTPFLNDGQHRALPKWRVENYRLKTNEVLTMTTQSIWSFDGRYFGVIDKSFIQGTVTPVLIFN